MIVDISNIILTDLKTTLGDNVTVLTSYQPIIPKFPTVLVEEIENVDDLATKDSGGVKYNNISFGIEIYTTGSRKISESKSIRNTINSIISQNYGLSRTFAQSVPNFVDENIHRYKLIYTGKIDSNKNIYRG